MSKKKKYHKCPCGAAATYVHWRALKGEEQYVCDEHYDNCQRCQPIGSRDKYAHLVRSKK